MNDTSDIISSIIKHSAKSGNEIASFKVNDNGSVDIVTVKATEPALQAPVHYNVNFSNDNEAVPIPNAIYNAQTNAEPLTEELKAVSALNNMQLTPEILQQMPATQDVQTPAIGENEQRLIDQAAASYSQNKHISR